MRFNFRNHPGTAPLVLFTILGAVAGMSRWDDAEASSWWPVWGALIVLGFLGPIYLYGAYKR